VRGALGPSSGADGSIRLSLKAPEANSVQVAGGDGLGGVAPLVWTDSSSG
jgi:hypothetical protein